MTTKEETEEEHIWDEFLKKPACKLDIHPMVYYHRIQGIWHCFCGKKNMDPIPPATKRIPVPKGIYDDG